MSDAGFTFPNDQPALNDNSLITAGGIRFQFGNDEIGPHALGNSAIFFPYSKIRDFLRPGSPVEPFFR